MVGRCNFLLKWVPFQGTFVQIKAFCDIRLKGKRYVCIYYIYIKYHTMILPLGWSFLRRQYQICVFTYVYKPPLIYQLYVLPTSPRRAPTDFFQERVVRAPSREQGGKAVEANLITKRLVMLALFYLDNRTTICWGDTVDGRNAAITSWYGESTIYLTVSYTTCQVVVWD